MQTLILFGSPRKNGNTAKLLDLLLQDIIGEKHIIYVYDLKVSPCTDCRYCYKKKECIHKDDMSQIYALIESCDNIIIASPMYFASYPSPLKAVIDRLQVYWSSKYIRKEERPKAKKGALIITSGTKWDNMFLPIEETTRHVFNLINANKIFSIYAVGTDKNPVTENKKLLDYCRACSKKLMT